MTSTVHPPINAPSPSLKVPSPSPGTPANEWANDTTSALRSTTSTSAPPSLGLSAADTSPGKELPGAFPKDEEGTGPDPTNMIDTAKAYIPAQQDVQQALTNAGQTAKSYLPASVATYLSGTTDSDAPATSLPSTEEKGTQPNEHVGGVGALPGRISEAGVAQLPAERVVDDASAAKGSGEGEKKAAGPRFGLAMAREKGWNKINDSDDGPTHSSPQPPAAPTLPSTDDPTSFTSPTGGVGALPGSKSETGVAVLPEERRLSAEAEARENEKPQPAVHTTPRIRALGGAGVQWGGVGVGPGVDVGPSPSTSASPSPSEAAEDEDKARVITNTNEIGSQGPGPGAPEDTATAVAAGGMQDDRKVAGLPPVHTGEKDKKETEKEKKEKKVEHARPDRDTGYHPALLHPASPASPSLPSEPADPEHKRSGSDTSGTSGGGEGGEGGKKKRGFLSRVKGEARVIAGKFGK